MSASRLAELKFHGVAWAPTAPTQEYCKRGAGTVLAAMVDEPARNMSFALYMAEAAATWPFEATQSVFFCHAGDLT